MSHNDRTSLAKQLAMPEAESFADVLTYLREWDHATMTPRSGKAARPDLIPAPRILSRMPDERTEVGPFCSIDLSQIGGPRHRSIAVEATDATMAALHARASSDDRMSFDVIAHASTGRALVVAQHGRIIGGVWLAYIDPATIPSPVTE